MCEHGDTVDCLVLVPARLAAEERDTWKVKPIDRCIAPIVKALNDAEIHTVASCCGHGKMHGSIVLADGRDLWVTSYDEANYNCEFRRDDCCTQEGCFWPSSDCMFVRPVPVPVPVYECPLEGCPVTYDHYHRYTYEENEVVWCLSPHNQRRN